MKPTNQRVIGFIFVLLAGVGFGFLGIFAKWGYRLNLSVGEILTWRFLTATVLLGFYLLLFSPKLLKVEKKQIFISLALGIFGYAVFSTLYFNAIQGISVALAAMLLFSFPIFVSLGSFIFYKEKMSPLQILSLVLSTVGLITLLWGPVLIDSFFHLSLAFLAALTYAAYVILSSRYQKNIHPLSSSFLVMLAATVTLFLYHQPDPLRLASFSIDQFGVFVGLAVISSIAPLTLFLAGLQRLKSSEASIAITIEPVVAAVAAFVVLGETMTAQQMAGALVIICALGLNTVSPQDLKSQTETTDRKS